MAKTQNNNPQTTDPNNPSTIGKAGNQGGIPENLSNIQPNPQTADNANTNPPTQQTNNNNNNTNTVTVTENPTSDQPKVTTGGKPPIKAIRLNTKYLKIEITDPNILEEVNTENKYATNLPFVGLQITINRKGGRHYIITQDRKEVDREIVSGVSRKEIEGDQESGLETIEFFETDRNQQ